MSKALLKQYADERETLDAFVTRTLDAAAAESRDLSATEVESLTKAKGRLAEVDAQVRVIADTIETRDAGLDLDALMRRGERQREQVVVGAEQVAAESLGSFVESDAYRSWGGSGKSDRFTLDARISGLRAVAPLVTSADPGKALMPTPQKYGIPQGAADTPLLDVIGRLPVSSGSIELVTYGSPKGATGAAVVAEAAAKPEATLVASATPVTVDTIAFWKQATRQLLQDAPAARSFIDDQLRRGLRTKVEAEVGAAIAAVTFAKTTGAAGAPMLEVARQGMATVQTAGYVPNAILASPAMAAEFDIALMQKTLLGAAFGAGVWGLQVVPVPGLTKAYLGDFSTAVWLLERTGIDVFISDSHADTFTSNIMTILAETRVKPVVVQPEAVTELVVTPKTT
jgi:HK97 family phage major capsid protein